MLGMVNCYKWVKNLRSIIVYIDKNDLSQYRILQIDSDDTL